MNIDYKERLVRTGKNSWIIFITGFRSLRSALALNYASASMRVRILSRALVWKGLGKPKTTLFAPAVGL